MGLEARGGRLVSWYIVKVISPHSNSIGIEFGLIVTEVGKNQRIKIRKISYCILTYKIKRKKINFISPLLTCTCKFLT